MSENQLGQIDFIFNHITLTAIRQDFQYKSMIHNQIRFFSLSICCLFALVCMSSCLTFSNNFTMNINSFYSSNSSIPYVQSYAIGQLSTGQQVNFQVEQIDYNGFVSNTGTEHSIFITNNNTSIRSIDYYGKLNVTATINQTDFYFLIIFPYYDADYFYNETSLSRYLVTLQIVNTTNIQKYVSILSYYYQKYIYINSTQSLNVSIASNSTLVNESVVLIKAEPSNQYKYSSAILQASNIAKVSSHNYTFSFSVTGGFYVLRIMNAKNTRNYSINYYSDSYQCPFSPQYSDSYKVFQPCICNSCLNCSKILYSNGSMFIEGDTQRCSCQANYYWNTNSQMCESSCSNFNSNSCGNGDCQMVSFWTGTACMMCFNVKNGHPKTNLSSLSPCSCDSNYSWRSNSCISSQNETVNNCVNSTQAECNSKCANHAWNGTMCVYSLNVTNVNITNINTTGLVVGLAVLVVIIIMAIGIFCNWHKIQICLRRSQPPQTDTINNISDAQIAVSVPLPHPIPPSVHAQLSSVREHDFVYPQLNPVNTRKIRIRQSAKNA